MKTAAFKRTVWDHYKKQGRALPWRNTRDPYKILVSEIMLQQTQVDRVIPKYKNFLKKFPTFKALAHASTAEVIREWQGLGYNRRALNLKKTAHAVMQEHGGRFPKDYASILALPGIGPYTAGALMAFVFDTARPIIETNIRTVYIHHFFPTKKVDDKKLLEIIEATLDTKNPREWYYALMDYGSYLKKTVGNVSRGSIHYKKQARFQGSTRQLRGAILRELARGNKSITTLANVARRSTSETNGALRAMVREGLVKERRGSFRIAD